MRKFQILLLLFAVSTSVLSQSYSGYLSSDLKEPTSYNTYVEFLQKVSEASPIISLDWMANSFQGRRIPYVTISENGIQDTGKLKFLIFASQHGNEPSGKEALLVLIKEFADGNLNQFLSNIDLIIVPQVNPDGGELGQRRSYNDLDLNRTHTNLANPETVGLHKLFHKFLPEVTLDVHETYFYRKGWLNYGFIKTYIQQLGILTNPNVDEKILEYSNNKILPEICEYVEEKGFSFSNYILGALYRGEPVRHSNPGVYDGRQSFGIYNTLSFLIEGKNGRTPNEELSRRRDGQYENILGLIEHVAENVDEIKTMVGEARDKLMNSKEGETVSIRSVYELGADSINVTLHDLKKEKDTVMTFPYKSKVVSTLDITSPKSYLIEKFDHVLIDLLNKHNIKYTPYKFSSEDCIYRYTILEDTISISDDKFFDVDKINVTEHTDYNDYVFVPVNQLAANMVRLIFEPQSMHGPDSRHGLIKGKKMEYFTDINGAYKILRLESN